MHKWLSSMGCQFLMWVCLAGWACSAFADVGPAAVLLARHEALKGSLQTNPYGRPLVLDSVEKSGRLKGDAYATVDYPFSTVSAELSNPDHWCDVMILHINTKYCHAIGAPSGTTLRVRVGKKTPQELADASRLDFKFSVSSATPDYLAFVLSAKEGPLGTSDYRIELEAVALSNTKTFLHLTYSYAANLVGRLAMQTYLGTAGSNRVGFTVIGKRGDGQPDYVAGMRGLVERNTMRYYLAIDSFLASSQAGTPAAQLEKRLQSWFEAVERYPRQLHEMDQAEYLQMKRAEYARQQLVE